MTPTAIARRLSRLTLALGWVTLAFMATVALSAEPCNTTAVYSSCKQAGVLPPVCSFWLNGTTKEERKTKCNSKTEKNRESNYYSTATVSDPYWNYQAQEFFVEYYCWTEYQCVYSELDDKCNQGNVLVNYGTLPVYLDVLCDDEVPVGGG